MQYPNVIEQLGLPYSPECCHKTGFSSSLYVLDTSPSFLYVGTVPQYLTKSRTALICFRNCFGSINSSTLLPFYHNWKDWICRQEITFNINAQRTEVGCSFVPRDICLWSINNENGTTFYIVGYFSNEIFRCQNCDDETTAAQHPLWEGWGEMLVYDAMKPNIRRNADKHFITQHCD